MWKDKSTFGEDVGYNFTFMSNISAPQSWGSFSAPFVFPPVNQMSQTKFLLATPFLLKGKGAVPLLCASMAFDG